ncbi:MAG: 2,3-bisphosphoglycerate-independent phosphoglycerate mutase [Actinomycetota bacterium]
MSGMDLAPLAIRDATTKLLLVVMDGLGGYADADHDTELEEAATPNLDALAADGITGLVEPVGPGITPGSGPGHLALFGYDPEVFELGRGALSAAGLEFELAPGDVAARGNFATLAPDGTILDRRAARIPDPEATAVVERLRAEVKLGNGVELFFVPEREHRVLVVLRGEGLDPRITDTDPQKAGVPPLESSALDPQAKKTAELVNELSKQVREALRDEPKANGLLLRGFDSLRELPSFGDRYGLRAGAVAIYPMYRGIARILGMDVLGRPKDLDEQIAVVREAWNDYDYFFLHHKYTDSAGEDGDRPRKVAAIEQLDSAVPALRGLGPDVFVVSGDHATPTQMAAHSWHPVPTLLWSTRRQRDAVDRFGERWCAGGALGIRPTKTLMPVMLAHAGRLKKYGA